MARVKRGTTVKQKHNKILARAKGYLVVIAQHIVQRVKKPKKLDSMHTVIVALKSVNFVVCGLFVLMPLFAVMV